MKKRCVLSAFLLAVVTGYAAVEPAEQQGEPMSIIALPEKYGSETIGEYVKLRLPYGMIVSNGNTNSAPRYCLFCRDKRTILNTTDVDVFLKGLEALPDEAVIDMVGKCTVPFYTKSGVDIDEQYKKISSLLERKRFKVVRSDDDDGRHVLFCYCMTGFIILDQPRESEQTPDGDIL